MIRTLILASLLAVSGSADGLAAQSRPASSQPRSRASAEAVDQRLEAAIRRAEAASGGRVGVAVVHVERGRRAGLHQDEPFPMASTFKLPTAIEVLAQAQAGKLRLADSVDVRVTDLRPGYSPVAKRHPNGYRTTVDELLAEMVIDSDNTAVDVLLRLIGGPAPVTARMRTLGVSGIRVDRGEGEIARDAAGLSSPEWRGTVADYQRETAAVPAGERAAAFRRFMDDPRDTSTPAGMARLLVMLQRGEALDAAGTAHLLNLMARANTGPGRLRAGLPAGTVLAHKTGTCGSASGARSACINDVGLITLPGGGHAAVTVYVKNARSDAAAEQAIASIARAVYAAWSQAR
jgi:beta-lactamase class A